MKEFLKVLDERSEQQRHSTKRYAAERKRRRSGLMAETIPPANAPKWTEWRNKGTTCCLEAVSSSYTATSNSKLSVSRTFHPSFTSLSFNDHTLPPPRPFCILPVCPLMTPPPNQSVVHHVLIYPSYTSRSFLMTTPCIHCVPTSPSFNDHTMSPSKPVSVIHRTNTLLPACPF